jgi:hypothetical protein
MCLPEIQIEATPSQTLLPYAPLHTSTRPVVGRQRRAFDWPVTRFVSSTVDLLQSEEVVPRYESHALVTLSPNLSVKGLDVRAQIAVPGMIGSRWRDGDRSKNQCHGDDDEQSAHGRFLHTLGRDLPA